MTSVRKLIANRSNACSSTGPRTDAGKMRAAQNARRHGLSVSVLADPEHSEDVEALAQTIAGNGAIAEARERARRIAEAQIDVIRVRQARRDLFTRHLNDQNLRPAISDREVLRILNRFSRQLDAGVIAADEITPLIKKKLEGPEKFAVILSNLAKQLTAMERYERRALSRRKFAIRDFDAARRHERNEAARLQR